LRCTYAGGVGATVPENQPSVLGKATQKRTAGKALKREHYGKISSLHVSTCEHSLLDFPEIQKFVRGVVHLQLSRKQFTNLSLQREVHEQQLCHRLSEFPLQE
jgi:hypothetical protein